MAPVFADLVSESGRAELCVGFFDAGGEDGGDASRDAGGDVGFDIGLKVCFCVILP